MICARGEALIREADKLSCESWNERMWADGEPIDPSPTVDKAINGGFPWLEIECTRCRTKHDVALTELPHVATTFVHDLATRLRCQRCAKAGKRPTATLLQLGQRPRHVEAPYYPSLPDAALTAALRPGRSSTKTFRSE
jgi:hypothetical protein